MSQPTHRPTRVITLATAHGAHRAPRIRTDWYRKLTLRRPAAVTPAAPALPAPPVVEAAPLPVRPASDPYRAPYFKAMAAAEHVLSLCPVPTGINVRMSYQEDTPVEVVVFLHSDPGLARLHAYRAALGGEVTVQPNGDRWCHQLDAVVHGVPVQVWTLTDAEDGAL